jgi:hypothetical protein
MDGGTEFRFVDDIERALREAAEAAGGKIFAMAGAYRLFVSTSSARWSTRCTSQSRPFCWARASTGSQGSTFPH